MKYCRILSRFFSLAIVTSLIPILAWANNSLMHVQGGDPDRGREAVRRYGCAACHAIPGFLNQGSNVGPPLHKIAKRAYLGGVIPNTPEDMIRWLRNPPAVDPRTAMPNLGVSETEARDIAAFLYTLK